MPTQSRTLEQTRNGLVLVTFLMLLAAILVAAAAAVGSPNASARPPASIPASPQSKDLTSAGSTTGLSVKPTIVLVHGAFADSSGWSNVIPCLAAKGYPTVAFSNPLRGIVADAEYLKTFLATIGGPIVLVGHSYGGAVITNAAADNFDVQALVYIAAYALDEGEAIIAANELGGGHTELPNHIVIRPFPGSGEQDGDGYIDPVYFRQLFAQDVDKTMAGVMAATQRPLTLSTLFTPSGEPAWESIPSWYMVAKHDHTIPPEAQRVMAERAGATTVEVRSSHVAMITKPGATTHLILDAATAQ